MYPDSAISLKQILQSPNFLRKARDRLALALLYHGLTRHLVSLFLFG